MSVIATRASQTRPASADGKSAENKVGLSVWSCLLLSADSRLRLRMKKGATLAGWNTIECSKPADAIRQAMLQNFPLALIDIRKGVLGEGSDEQQPYNDLLRVLQTTTGNLVVVCDQEATAEGELWSRQLGAWMYLPSVDEQSDLARICREAKAIAEKLRGPTVEATATP